MGNLTSRRNEVIKVVQPRDTKKRYTNFHLQLSQSLFFLFFFLFTSSSYTFPALLHVLFLLFFPFLPFVFPLLFLCLRFSLSFLFSHCHISFFKMLLNNHKQRLFLFNCYTSSIQCCSSFFRFNFIFLSSSSFLLFLSFKGPFSFITVMFTTFRCC